jgi:hypothetical protein
VDIRVQVLSMNKIPAIIGRMDIVDVSINIDNVQHELVFCHDTVSDFWPRTYVLDDFLKQYHMIEQPLLYIVRHFYNESQYTITGEPFEFPLTIDDDWTQYFTVG